MSREPTHSALLWIVAAAFFMQSLDTTIVNTALPSIAQSLHASPLAMQPVVVVYTLTMAMLTPASGWLADRFGTRRVFSLAILVFVLASIGCAASHTLGQLVAAARAAGHRRLDAAADRPARRAAPRAGRTVRRGDRVRVDRRPARPDRRADARRLAHAGDFLALGVHRQRAGRRGRLRRRAALPAARRRTSRRRSTSSAVRCCRSR